MQTTSYKQTLINFLNENLTAAGICLNSRPEGGSGYKENDVLGFPAAVLMLSVVDAIGTIELGPGKSFGVLSTQMFSFQKINEDIAKDLYQAYRNPFLHNNILVFGRFLGKGDGSGKPFIIEDNKVKAIDLASLLKICKKAIKEFELTVTEEKIIGNSKIKEHITNRSLYE